jgi:competence protein ComEC
VLVRSFLFFNFYLVGLIGILSLALILFFILISKNKFGLLLAIFVFAFCFGVFRFQLVDKSAPVFLESQVGGRVVLSGVIVDEPDTRENNERLVVAVGDKGRETKILITADFGEEFKYGDLLDLRGRLEKPENFTTDQGKDFDYVNYLRKDRILYVMSYPEIEIVSNGHGNPVRRILFTVKDVFLDKVNMIVRNPENLLLGGLILGERSSFSESMRENFVNTGTIHIVALSGYNVTIVAEWFMKIFSFLPMLFGAIAGILAIFLFVLMTGGSSTALRAGVMASLALFARATGRNYDVARALIVAGVGMIFFNPFILAYDVSFQLSFIATVALIFFTPKIEKHFIWVPKNFGLRDIISVTTAVYIFVLPFILYKMGNLSLVALPANVAILPFIPPTMLLGFLTGFLGLIHPILSLPFGYIAYALLHYEISVVNFLAQIPFAAITVPDFPLWLTLAIYVYFIYRLFGNFLRPSSN